MTQRWPDEDPEEPTEPEQSFDDRLEHLEKLPPEEARGALSEEAKLADQEAQAAYARRTAEKRYWRRGDFWWGIVAALMMAAVVALAVGSILGRR